MRYVKPVLVALAATGLMTGAALAETTKLRIQTHYAPETVSGKLAAQFADDVQVMSNGEIQIEMFYASSVVKSVETFDAAATGILDCDMTGGAYQTGKNPAFQFVGDIMGGYDTPYQQLSWLYHGDGFAAADSLYNKYGMKLVGWWVYGQESLSSSKPIAGPADLKDWKFRSPPGLETEIFANLGAKPIVMDFTEIFTALETGIIWKPVSSMVRMRRASPTMSASASMTLSSMPTIRGSIRCRRITWPAIRPNGTPCLRATAGSWTPPCRSWRCRPR
jgi:TRAP-type C4-dicarboxylate transport system substrate-binding protein